MLSTSFRNTLIASTLLVGASIILASPAVMAQISDDGIVSGTVQEVNTIGFAPETETPIISGDAVAAYPMGDLTIRNNAAAGWGLEVQSLNGGELVNGGESITYTALTVADITGVTITPVDLATAATNEPLVTAAPYSAEVAGGITRAVTASIAAGQHIPVGTYTDTLTFTLTAN